MSKKTESQVSELRVGLWLNAVRVLSCLAFGLSSLLLWKSFSGQELPGCGIESGCGAVLRSRWAYVFGVPVSLAAVLTYCVLLIAAFLYPSQRERVRGLMIAASVA